MMDPSHLRTFVTVIERGSFSAAARVLGLSQPSVSDHIKRLEHECGQKLFWRDTHSIALTPDGQVMETFARAIIEVIDRAESHFNKRQQRQVLRFGASEDLVSSWLPDVIRDFTAHHPDVNIEFTIALSHDLQQKFEDNQLDLVLCKRSAHEHRGEFVWREPLVWVSANGAPVLNGDENEVQLVLYPPPSITRHVALERLEEVGLRWRIAFSSSNLNGLTAATRIGLGMMAHARRLIPFGLMECNEPSILPTLGDVEFVLLEKRNSSFKLLKMLAEAIQAKALSGDGIPA
ncbi:LysR family transcriptional regulator [Allorhizobium terrae]|uniref:HTH-type transcriptional regulator TtuA n=2 Tax=Allorhizobium terrae TaxID=1848972 RepID=A0A4V3W7N5_9HYPH|nr:LysR family transcriptional regulator [Allorhizobium terrae]